MNRAPKRRMRLGLLAMLLVPLLLVLHAPLLAAVVPGALLTVASLDALEQRDARALPAAHVVDPADGFEAARIERAVWVPSQSARVSSSSSSAA